MEPVLDGLSLADGHEAQSRQRVFVGADGDFDLAPACTRVRPSPPLVTGHPLRTLA
ncbi:hypothetical protein SAV14893_059610 [Streptomyces avermitilis]|uniref:Uncharacterized protein n=2 Tax=Streptomyces avermitilis TaxID=33903 RepID=Q829S6_STRAW|nr:hypothetical protein SAVERM_6333 [Streptomyces avermitilis MA-4680 = NBRC 14893]GDY66568.1 hypothetical protein SAV14893_059610 [Streptomyces avermitilis]GDY73195.1 hypothetical protein SAV31267_026800 [Streptomyces avermitilis]